MPELFTVYPQISAGQSEAAFTRGVQSHYTMDGKTTSFNA